MLVTMRARCYRQFVLNGAKDRRGPGPANSCLNEPLASQALNQRRFAGPVSTTKATVRPEGNI
jgi:hypothetical protein